ncbi:MAG TPA: flagellar biosynthesis protein FlgC [Desulfobulbus sp.]|nr:flagellar biosynthesis protein FlgC [Desulfobulbus sp.]
MITGIQAAVSSLQAFSMKLENNGHNIANMNTDGFKKGRVLLAEPPQGGVSARPEKVNQPGSVVAEQTSAGYEMVEQSNVDLAGEIPDMIRSARAYEANLKTLQAGDEMAATLLDIRR